MSGRFRQVSHTFAMTQYITLHGEFITYVTFQGESNVPLHFTEWCKRTRMAEDLAGCLIPHGGRCGAVLQILASVHWDGLSTVRCWSVAEGHCHNMRQWRSSFLQGHRGARRRSSRRTPHPRGEGGTAQSFHPPPSMRF